MRNFIRSHPRGKCFVSHSYRDHSDLETLRSVVGPGVDLFIFPAITVPPEHMVSNDLLKEIEISKSLVYLTGDASRNSPWVTLERDYALRAKKPVFSFDATTKKLSRDRSRPMDLPVFPSYSHTDKEQVGHLLRVMKEDRYFDLFKDDQIAAGDDIRRSLEKGIMSRLERGGYVVAFWTRSASESAWVREELNMSVQRYPEQVLLAKLDDAVLPIEFMHRNNINLYGREARSIDMNRLDDLIVRIYWLIDKNRNKT